MQDENVANFIPRIGLALWFESQQSNFLSAPGTLSTPHLSLPSPLFIHFILSCRPLVTYLPYYVDHAQISRGDDATTPTHTHHTTCFASFHSHQISSRNNGNIQPVSQSGLKGTIRQRAQSYQGTSRQRVQSLWFEEMKEKKKTKKNSSPVRMGIYYHT